MSDKQTKTIELIERALTQFKSPAIMWSGGKDSMVMLFIIMRWVQAKLPVLLFKQPNFQRKYFFAHRIAADWKFDLHTPQPSSASVCTKNGVTELIYSYNAGTIPIHIPIGCLPYAEHEDWKCGIDMLNTPKAQSEWIWDAVFIGHKKEDDDPLQGKIPIESDIVLHQGGPAAIFPLREWTDAEIWEFIEKHNVPINTFRYTKQEGEWKNDKHWDSDYHPYCVNCLDPAQPNPVYCPKLKVMIEHGHKKDLNNNPIAASSYIRS